jgi:hypothetical protein
MTTSDLKIAFINVITLGFNFMQIDILLKIILTAVAIEYPSDGKMYNWSEEELNWIERIIN